MSARIPAERLRPHLERAVEQWGGVVRFAAAHRHLGIHDRLVWTVMSGEYETVTMGTADKLVTAIDPMLWHVEFADLLPSKKPARPSGRLRVSEQQLADLYDQHCDGFSFLELAESVWKEAGYASQFSCASSISQAMDRRGWAIAPNQAPRRRTQRILTEKQIRSAHKLYQGGMSLDEIARGIWREAGYASVGAATTSLSRLFAWRGLPTRPHLHRGSLIDAEALARIREMYDDGFSFAEIGETMWRELGYVNATSCANAALKRFNVDGIPKRGRGESHRLKWQRVPHPLTGVGPPVVFGRRMKEAA